MKIEFFLDDDNCEAMSCGGAADYRIPELELKLCAECLDDLLTSGEPKPAFEVKDTGITNAQFVIIDRRAGAGVAPVMPALTSREALELSVLLGRKGERG